MYRVLITRRINDFIPELFLLLIVDDGEEFVCMPVMR